MNLEERVADLERRLAVLEGGRRTGPRVDGGDFWALNVLKDQLSGAGIADGGVLYTGSVRLPTGEEYAWQMTVLTEDLLDADATAAAESLAALGHPVRLRLLREIIGGRRTAAELAELDEVGTTGQIYHHLRQLTGTGWLHTTARGRYEVPPARVVPLLVALATARP
ncbi:ArsR/SmtB family transcription factor [Streptomyces sp. XY006]|uniref:ArsR/SmtB family transcription factor n=1 Tax=Streptomyces sp. XY006 TaxID=2021410 RepID=UPI000B8BF874|nr:helix-turn-helix domain-containing protein [Streptomyces sp. XY006]OXS30972.1 ArsR family transcriptional regulator [Streptomyces sp. XY006]